MSGSTKLATIATFSLEEVLPFVEAWRPGDRIYADHRVKMNSLRYQVFQRSLRCAICGIQGSFFLLQRHRYAPGNRAHLNLFAVDGKGQHVLMTKDHIVPRSKGGSDDLTNLQTCCLPCNSAKGATLLPERAWFVAPYRVRPGNPMPGTYQGDGFDGPSPQEMTRFRGPFLSAGAAAEAAASWRASGRGGALFLLLVEAGYCTHTSKFDPKRLDSSSLETP